MLEAKACKKNPADFSSHHMPHTCFGELMGSFHCLSVIFHRCFQDWFSMQWWECFTWESECICVPVPPKPTLGWHGQISSLHCLRTCGHELEPGQHPAYCFRESITALFSLKGRAPSVETRGIIQPGFLLCTVPAQRPVTH